MKENSAKILVVEDEVIISYALRHTLLQLGYTVLDVVHSGHDAIQKAEEYKDELDLILMDVQLRDSIDGIAAAEEIRNRSPKNAPPIIYLTAYADMATVARAKITEPFGYILKPFEERELSICIEMAFYKYRTEKRIKEAEERLAITLKSMGKGVVTTDRAGRVNFMNFLAEARLGLSKKTIGSKHLDEILEWNIPDEKEFQGNPLRYVLRTGISLRLPSNTYAVHSGQHYDISKALISPIINDESETVGAVIVLKDEILE